MQMLYLAYESVQLLTILLISGKSGHVINDETNGSSEEKINGTKTPEDDGLSEEVIGTKMPKHNISTTASPSTIPLTTIQGSTTSMQPASTQATAFSSASTEATAISSASTEATAISSASTEATAIPSASTPRISTTISDAPISTLGSISTSTETSPMGAKENTASANPTTEVSPQNTSSSQIDVIPLADVSLDITYYLYNADNLEVATIYSSRDLLNLTGLSSNLTIIIHDWEEDHQTEWVQDAKNHLAPYLCGVVIIVDWSKLAKASYISAASSTNDVGTTVGTTLSQIEMHNVSIYGLGMGMGGQIVETANFNFNSSEAQGFHVLWLLSPAGNYYTTQGSVHLSPYGSTIAYVFITNAGRFGLYRTGEPRPITLLFNDGIHQPGCTSEPQSNPVLNLNDPFLLIVGVTNEDVCSHRMSYPYFLQTYKLWTKSDRYNITDYNLPEATTVNGNVDLFSWSPTERY